MDFGVEEGLCGIWKMGRVLKGIEMRLLLLPGFKRVGDSMQPRNEKWN